MPTAQCPLLVREIQVGDLADVRARGEPVPMQDVADQIRSLVQAPGLERPIVVGYSIAAAAAGLYAATDPTRGIVIIDRPRRGLRALIEHCNRRSNGA